MTTYSNAIFNISEENLIVSDQSIDSSVNVLNAVYKTDNIWFVSKVGRMPQGIYLGNNRVAISGLITVSTALMDGKTYYVNDAGALSTVRTNIKAGVALTPSILCIDFQIYEQIWIPYAGYICGGLGVNDGGGTTSIQRLIFSTGTTESTSVSLTNPAWHVGKVQTQVAAYLMGGGSWQLPIPIDGTYAILNQFSNIDKLIFANTNSNIAKVALASTLSEAKTVGATCSSSISGYYISGLFVSNSFNNTIQQYFFKNKIEKFNFNTESNTSIIQYLANIDSKSFAQNTEINTTRFGYTAGGYNNSSFGYADIGTLAQWQYYSDFYRLTYSTDIYEMLNTSMSVKRSHFSSLLAKDKVLLCGGGNYSSGTHIKIIDEFIFDTESCFVVQKTLVDATNQAIGCSDYTYGYIIGNQSMNGVVTNHATTKQIYSVSFDTITISLLSALLPTEKAATSAPTG